MKEIYQTIVRCAYGKNFTWVTIAGIAQKTGRHPVTVWRNIKKLVDAGLIAKGFNEDIQKEGFYLLPHPELVAHMIKKGIKFVISKICCWVAGDQKQEQDEAVQGQKESESEAQENCILQSENCEMQSPLYKGVENDVPPLPPVGEIPNQEFCMAVSEAQREECCVGEQEQDADHSDQDNEQYQPIFDAVLSELEQKQDLIPLVALLKSCVVQEEGDRVQIETDKYCLQAIKKHILMLDEAFQRHGITQLFLSVMSNEQQQQHERNLLTKERQEKTRKFREERLAAERAAETERQRIAVMTPEEQFGLLAVLYPQPANGYRDMRPWDYWPAWKNYIAMRKTGQIPPIFDLLRVLKEQKLSKDWNRDNGRWIPGLFKWLNNRPWAKDNAAQKLQTGVHRKF